MVFCDHDIDNAVSSGTEGEPNTERNHSATDAIFIGGILPGSASNSLPDGYSIGTEGGSIYLVVKEDGIEVLGDTKVTGDITIIGDVAVTRGRYRHRQHHGHGRRHRRRRQPQEPYTHLPGRADITTAVKEGSKWTET